MDVESGVAELQGPYGPVRISERFLQLIWLRKRFDANSLRTVDGRSLEILAPGDWNHAEGPDFLHARWRIDGGGIQSTAVELHFYAEDWFRHGHDRDPNFDQVGLHVVLFAPDQRCPPVVTQAGGRPKTLALLSYLEEDLESLAEEEALHDLDERWQADWLGAFRGLDLGARLARLGAGATRRWRRKALAGNRLLEEAGWEEAMHRKTLEVLGFSRNRRQMLEIAFDFPYQLLSSDPFTVETLFLSRGNGWKTAGIRPANHPRRRLGQYLELVRSRPSWPFQVRAWGRRLCRGIGSDQNQNQTETTAYRRQRQLQTWKTELRTVLLDDKITGTRLETWVTEAFLPLYQAESGLDCYLLWHHWFAGDFPESMRRRVPELFQQSEKVPVLCNGTLQGLTDLVMAEETGYEQLEFSDLPRDSRS